MGNFEAEWSLAASNCDVDTLKAGVDQVCSTNCQSKESLYQMGGCSSDCPDNCDICASSKCFKCSFGFLNYFGECLLDCPRCYHGHGLVTDICYSNYYLENDDTSSYANPTRFYVDFNKSRSNRDGSLQNPFKTLKEALDHNCDQFVEILLSPGIHIIDYSLSANEIPDLSLKLTPDCEVCAENTILQIQTPDFVFPTANLKEIYIENIIFDGEKALDPNCVSPNCPYCSYTAAEDSINYINPCASFENKNLFTISMSTNLCLRNTKFKNMRYDLQSIIYSSGGKIRLYNVDFYNIKIKDTAFDDPFYIITIKCDYSCTNILIYQTGSISLIGNGFEM